MRGWMRTCSAAADDDGAVGLAVLPVTAREAVAHWVRGREGCRAEARRPSCGGKIVVAVVGSCAAFQILYILA